MKKNILVTKIISLCILLTIIPIIQGYNITTITKEQMDEYYTFENYYFPQTYVSEKNVLDVQFNHIKQDISTDLKEFTKTSLNDIIKREIPQTMITNGLMDSAWPMHGHDTRHTGLSPYSIENNFGEEKWWYKIERYCFVEGSPVIDYDGVIYFGCWDNSLYAMYPNGTLKWSTDIGGTVETSPAIAEDGTIYVGTHFAPIYGTHLFAIDHNGTHKWEYNTGNMLTSPAIAEDGTVYVGDGGSSIIALNPNGTLKWKFSTGDVVLSSPAIDKNGIIYFGSHDNNVYALYPNGTLKWKFNTGNWVHGCPTIADDGTIYIDSDDQNLYAFSPDDGSVIWQCTIGSVWGSPALDKEGNIYVGTWEKKFYSIYPNGTVRWSIELSRRVWGMSAAVSDDGTIFFGTCDFEGHDGGPLYIVNYDGTVRKILSNIRMFWASPAIGSDGTVYVCSRTAEYVGGSAYRHIGYLRALNELDPDAPTSPVISGRTNGHSNRVYEYKLKSTSPLGNDVYYWVEWGDLSLTQWIGPYHSGETVKVSHKWDDPGNYTIRSKTKDTDNLWGPWGELKVRMTKDKAVNFNSVLLKLSEKLLLLQKFLFISHPY